jgi:hypothetical protein
MEFKYPVFVLLRDCNEVISLSSPSGWKQFEAVDIENHEYEAWDASGQKLVLEASGITAWNPGEFTVHGFGELEDLNRFHEIKARAAAK